MLREKVILITGGTGSFGKEFVRSVIQQSPKKQIIYSRDELKQFEMAREFSDSEPQSPLRYFIGDVRDENRLKKALRDVEIVVHAAALKQVPAAEYNPTEAVATNIYGAQSVINACLATPSVKKVVFLSTDKAVEPCNLYGMTKAVAEKLFVNANLYSDKYPRNTMFSVVRYGNVMGSRGSVIPFFRERAIKRWSLPVTHKDMTRFWITLEDAVQFVLRSIGDMRGGEIFVPKLKTLRMVDLAILMIEKYGGGDIVYTGIRPGEKLHEKLISYNEMNVKEEEDRFIIYPSYNIYQNDESIWPYAQFSGIEYISAVAPRINIEEINV